MNQRLEVVVFAYNHEAFIEQALNSVLSQITDFAFSIRVHDDASTDNTSAVVERVLADARIDWRLERAPHNRYASGIEYFHEFIAASDAEFVAFLDGDDFWVDNVKLQTQVDLLDKHRGAALCHHRTSMLDGDSVLDINWPPLVYREEVLPGEALRSENIISSSSVVLRMSMFPRKMPQGFNGLRIGDYPMWAFATDAHEIAFVDRVMSVYRVHGANIWATLSPAERFDREIEARIYIAANIAHNAHWRTALVDRIAEHVAGVEGSLVMRARADAEVQASAAEGARQELQQLLASRSWRVTQPLRAITRFFSRSNRQL